MAVSLSREVAARICSGQDEGRDFSGRKHRQHRGVGRCSSKQRVVRLCRVLRACSDRSRRGEYRRHLHGALERVLVIFASDLLRGPVRRCGWTLAACAQSERASQRRTYGRLQIAMPGPPTETHLVTGRILHSHQPLRLGTSTLSQNAPLGNAVACASWGVPCCFRSTEPIPDSGLLPQIRLRRTPFAVLPAEPALCGRRNAHRRGSEILPPCAERGGTGLAGFPALRPELGTESWSQRYDT